MVTRKYVMTEKIFNRLVKRNGGKPIVCSCRNPIEVGQKVVSHQSNSHTIQKHEECEEEGRI